MDQRSSNKDEQRFSSRANHNTHCLIILNFGENVTRAWNKTPREVKLQQSHCVQLKTHLWRSGIKRETFFRSVAFQDPVHLFDFRQLAHGIPEETLETNCIKFEYWNLHPHTWSTSVPIRYNIHVAHDCVLKLWIVNRTIYFIANRSQTVTNSDTKGSHSFITTKTPNYVCFFRLDDRKPINQYKRQT
jgi:hypothetical protein